MIFTWNDIVVAKATAPAELRPGCRAWIVGISVEADRSGEYLNKFPFGNVYTIEFEDGSAVEAEEANLELGL